MTGIEKTNPKRNSRLIFFASISSADAERSSLRISKPKSETYFLISVNDSNAELYSTCIFPVPKFTEEKRTPSFFSNNTSNFWASLASEMPETTSVSFS